MNPHPVLIKRIVWFQMILVASMVTLGSFYALGLWINSRLLLYLLDPIIYAVATVIFYGFFLIPVAWMLGRFVILKILSRKPVVIELRDRLQRLVVETLHRMSINPGSTRFVVRKGSSSASVRRQPHRDTIAVGEKLMKNASDEEIMAILGHELGHILKRHLSIKGIWNVVCLFTFLAVIYKAGDSHSSAVLATTALFALILAGIPLNWRIEYAADRFSAERLGARPMVSALEKLKLTNPDCVSFTHPPLSRRIRRIQEMSIPSLTMPVPA